MSTILRIIFSPFVAVVFIVNCVLIGIVWGIVSLVELYFNEFDRAYKMIWKKGRD